MAWISAASQALASQQNALPTANRSPVEGPSKEALSLITHLVLQDMYGQTDSLTPDAVSEGLQQDGMAAVTLKRK